MSEHTDQFPMDGAPEPSDAQKESDRNLDAISAFVTSGPRPTDALELQTAIAEAAESVFGGAEVDLLRRHYRELIRPEHQNLVKAARLPDSLSINEAQRLVALRRACARVVRERQRQLQLLLNQANKDT